MAWGKEMIGQSDKVFTIDEVATYLKKGKLMVCRLGAERDFPAVKLGGSWHFCASNFAQRITYRIVKPTADEMKRQ